MRRFALALLAGGLLVTAANVLAGEPATDTGRIKSLVAQLGSDRWDEREKATNDLLQVGEPALPLLREARNNADREVRRRADNLVPRIETQVTTARILTPAKVHFTCKDLTIAQAIAEFTKQTGHPIQLAPSANPMAERRITLDTGETTFWDAFDQFCAKAGVREVEVAADAIQNQPAYYGKRAIMMRGGVRGGRIAYYGGPSPIADPTLVLEDGAALPTAALRNTSIRVRALAPKESALPNLPDGAKQVALHLEVRTETRIELIELNAVRITSATDANGQRVHSAQDYIDASGNGYFDPDMGMMIQQLDYSGDMGGFGSLRQVPITVAVDSKGAQKLTQLSGVICGKVRSALEPLVTIDDLSKAVGKAHSASDGGEVKILESKRGDDGLYTLKLELKDGVNSNQLQDVQMLRMNQLRAIRGNMAIEAQHTTLTKESAATLPIKLYDAKGKVLEVVNGDVSLSPENPLVRQYTLVYKPVANDTPAARFEYLGRREVEVEVPFTLKDIQLAPKSR